MPESRFSRSAGGAQRQRKPPSERAWKRAPTLEPRSAGRHPEMISDGGGLPFAPSALAGLAPALDPGDPAVAALLAQLAAHAAPKRASRAPWKRDSPPPPAAAAPPSLDGWRELARSDDQVLFGRGRVGQLLTVAVRRDARRETWSVFGESAARPLRASRDGIRASSWRVDPTHQPSPADTVARILVTEQTFAGGQRAERRVLVPDLHIGADELVLTVFVTPLPGFKARSPNPETPVRVVFPETIGERRLVDGALYGA